MCPFLIRKKNIAKVESTWKRRACMKKVMKVEEVREVCEDRNKLRYDFLSTPIGKIREYVCMFIHTYILKSY